MFVLVKFSHIHNILYSNTQTYLIFKFSPKFSESFSHNILTILFNPINPKIRMLNRDLVIQVLQFYPLIKVSSSKLAPELNEHITFTFLSYFIIFLFSNNISSSIFYIDNSFFLDRTPPYVLMIRLDSDSLDIIINLLLQCHIPLANHSESLHPQQSTSKS